MAIDFTHFFTKPSKTKKITTQLQVLQLLQIIVEFYQEKLSDVPDSLELNEEQSKEEIEDKEEESLSKEEIASVDLTQDL
mgnify:CR=1 FL=1